MPLGTRECLHRGQRLSQHRAPPGPPGHRMGHSVRARDDSPAPVNVNALAMEGIVDGSV
jgi:hypothetical protein